MKVICIGSLKGGVGKSNFCFQLSSMLAIQGYKVCVVDADPQANSTTNFGIDESVEDYKSMVDVFDKKISPEEVIVKAPIEELPTLDVLPSSVLLTATEISLVSRNARELIFKKYLRENKEYFNQYNFLVIDTAPSMGLLNQNMFVVSDSIILLTDISFNGYKGCELYYTLWSDIAADLEIKNNIKAFVINKYDRRIKLSDQFINFCQANEFKDIMLKTFIPDNIKIKESEIAHKPIVIYDTKNKGYDAYQKVYKELIIREVI